MASPAPPFIAATAQRSRQLLQHRLDEAADAVAQTSLNRVEPSFARKQPIWARSDRTILVHGALFMPCSCLVHVLFMAPCSWRGLLPARQRRALVVEPQPETTSPRFQ